MTIKIKLLIALFLVSIIAILYVNYFNVYLIVGKAGFTEFSPSGGRIWKNMILLIVILSLGVFISFFLNNKYFNLVFYGLNTALELFVFIKIWFLFGLFYMGIYEQNHTGYIIPLFALIFLLITRILFNIKRIKESLIEWFFLFIASSIYSFIITYAFLKYKDTVLKVNPF